MSSTPAQANGPRGSGFLVRWGTTITCLVLMAWAATDENNWSIRFPRGGQGADYYNLLVDGLLEGHLYMKVAPDASGQLPVLMDASRYQGKYYLYFGIVPALLTFLPYSFLTGHDMPENLAALLLVAGGFLLNVLLYTRARHRYFPACPRRIDVCAIILLAFGAGTPILLFDANFYEVALAGGYLCFSAVLYALYQAIHAERHATAWLAVASLCGGLAVGCRPTYLLALPLLLIPALPRFRLGAGAPGGRGLPIRELAAILIPASVVGLFLMAYNYGRFGDPFEFGFKYQLNALMSSGLPFARAHFIWPNLTWYYLTPPVLSPYFPYVFPVNASDRPVDYYGYELIHGQWLVLPLLLICLAGLVRARLWRVALPRGLLVLSGIAGLAFVVLLAVLLTFGFRANRYVADFQPALVVALALTGTFAIAQPALAAGWTGRIHRGLFGGAALLLALFNFLAGLQWMDHVANARAVVYRPLAYYGNYPSYWLHLLGLMPYGPFRFQATFRTPAQSVREPLLAAGTNGYTDVLYAAQHPNGQTQFTIDHNNTGGLQSVLLTIAPGIPHVIEADLGSFYPPRLHPYYDGWDKEQIDRRKTWTRITLDGVPVIEGSQPFNDAWPDTVVFGRNPRNHDLVFSGTIGNVQRQLPRFADPPRESGLWSLEVEFPRALNVGQPLLASGTSGHGNLLFVEAVSETEVRFGYDQWGLSLTHSPPIRVDFGRAHALELLVGSQIERQAPAGPALGALATQMQVWLDGRLVWWTPIDINRQSYDRAVVGMNTQGFSTAAGTFGGVYRRLPLSETAKQALRQRGLTAAGNPPP